MDEALTHATDYMRNHAAELIRDFSWVTDVQKETTKDISTTALTMQSIQSLFLVGIAFAGLGAALPAALVSTQVAGITGFLGNNYIAVNGMYHGLKASNPYVLALSSACVSGEHG